MNGTPTSAVSSSLKKLTTLGSKLTVKRKSKTDEKTGRPLWWFIIKGNDSVWQELEGEWDRVNLQTNWKLETCYMSKLDSGSVNPVQSEVHPIEPTEPTDANNNITQ